MRPPSAIETLESPPGKGVVEERFKRGTTEDIVEADVRSDGASGIQMAQSLKSWRTAEDTHAGGRMMQIPKAMALNDGYCEAALRVKW